MGYSTRVKKPVSYTYDYNVSEEEEEVYEYNANPDKIRNKKKEDETILINDVDLNSSNSDSQYWKKSKNPLKRKSLQEKKEEAQLRQVLKLSILEQENHSNVDNNEDELLENLEEIKNNTNKVEIIVNTEAKNVKNEENDLVDNDLLSELSKTDVSDLSSISIESDFTAQFENEKGILQDDSSSDFEKEKSKKIKKSKRKRENSNNSNYIEKTNVISSDIEDEIETNSKEKTREHTPVLPNDNDKDDDIYIENEIYVSDGIDDSDDDYYDEEYTNSRKKNNKKKKLNSKSISKKDSKGKTTTPKKTSTPPKKTISNKDTELKKTINSPIKIKSPKHKIGISKSSLKLPSTTSKLKSINTPINSSIMSRPPRIGLSRRVHIKPLHSYLHNSK
eukprot:jgi/Orpsp1_1/1189147/evm.model.d7180000069841.1